MPTIKTEWNLSTVLSACALIATVIGWGTAFGASNERLDTASKAQAVIAADNQAQDKAIEELRGKSENLAYRVTVQEQNSAALQKTLEEVKTAVSTQTADIRVIREILARIDTSQRRKVN